jgi:hypothetical protein
MFEWLQAALATATAAGVERNETPKRLKAFIKPIA